MNRLLLLLLPALLSLLIAFTLILSCGGGGGDDNDDDRFADFTCPDFKLGNNPHEPGTPECDSTCIEWDDQWFLEVYRRYVECIGSVPLGASDYTCFEAAEACLEKTEKPKKLCAEQCNGCLIGGMECEAACPDDLGCEYDCLVEIYECNGWSIDCYNACQHQYNDCYDEATYGLELIDCVEELIDCTIPCRESTANGDDDIHDF